MSLEKYKNLKLGDKVYMRWTDEGGQQNINEITTVTSVYSINDIGHQIQHYYDDEGKLSAWNMGLSQENLPGGLGFKNHTEVSWENYVEEFDRFETCGQTCRITIV